MTYGTGRCGGLPANWHSVGDDFPEPTKAPYLLRVEPHGYQWNLSDVTEPALRQYLGEMGELEIPPPLTVMYDRATDCTTVAAVRHMIETRVRCAEIVCVEYAYDEWEVRDARSPKAN